MYIDSVLYQHLQVTRNYCLNFFPLGMAHDLCRGMILFEEFI